MQSIRAAQPSTAQHTALPLTIPPLLVGLLPGPLALRHAGPPAAPLAAPRPLLRAGQPPGRAALPQRRIPHDKGLGAVRRAVLVHNCRPQGRRGLCHDAVRGAGICALLVGLLMQEPLDPRKGGEREDSGQACCRRDTAGQQALWIAAVLTHALGAPATCSTPSSSRACSAGLATVAVVTANVGCTGL